jgi:hypothetical protein
MRNPQPFALREDVFPDSHPPGMDEKRNFVVIPSSMFDA